MRPGIEFRKDYDAARLRALAKSTRNAGQSRRALALAEMFAWYADEGRSLYGLAKKLHQDAARPPRSRTLWSVLGLRVILTNPVYTGEVYAGPIQEACRTGSTATPRLIRPWEDWITVASIPAIVTQEQFDRVQAKPVQSRQFVGRNNTAQSYLSRGLVSCCACGLACFGRCLQLQYRYYCCRGKLSAHRSYREAKCRSRFIAAEPVESLVWADLCRLLTHPEAIGYALERAHGGHWLPHDLQARRDALRCGQVRVGQQIERLTGAYLSEVVGLEEYRRRRHDLKQETQSLGVQRQQPEARVDRQSEIARVSLSIDEFCRRVQKGSSRRHGSRNGSSSSGWWCE